ncbi:MAG: polysaccharide pyruvyl transferase family protein, partial [Bacteroidaceae bacterium]|nr:polysaccharide pyruvyl transferase family protein [Bacteroidaceae bacterium]
MKIAILTFWNSNDNYGQILQGYALQSYLKKLGHSAYIVRYEERKTYPAIFQERGLKPFIKRIIKW